MGRIVNVESELKQVSEHWSPRVIAKVNDHYLKVAKVQGSLVWHSHEQEDELFLLVKGTLRLEIEGEEPVELRPGELFVVPRGVRHNPVADEECWIVLIEPAVTKHTGDVEDSRARSIADQLSGFGGV